MIADLILRAIDTQAQWPRPRSQNAKRQGGSALAARRQLLINLGSRRMRRASLTRQRCLGPLASDKSETTERISVFSFLFSGSFGSLGKFRKLMSGGNV